jgi:hypothetical protein
LNDDDRGSFNLTSPETRAVLECLEKLPLARAEALHLARNLAEARHALRTASKKAKPRVLSAVLKGLGLAPGKSGRRSRHDVAALATLYERLLEPGAWGVRADGTRVPIETVVAPGARVFTGQSVALAELTDEIERLGREEALALREALAIHGAGSIDAAARALLERRLAALDDYQKRKRLEMHARVQDALAKFPEPLGDDTLRFAEAISGTRLVPPGQTPEEALRLTAGAGGLSDRTLWDRLKRESDLREARGETPIPLPPRP